MRTARLKKFFAFGLGIAFVFALFALVQAIAPGSITPTFGPTDDDVDVDFLRDTRLVENQITTCNGSTVSYVSASCPAGYKTSGGGCYGSWINGCRESNAKADRSGWECNCTCVSGTTLIAQALCVNSE